MRTNHAIGRRPRIGPETVELVRRLMAETDSIGGYVHTYREVAELAGVSVASVVRIERQRRADEAARLAGEGAL